MLEPPRRVPQSMYGNINKKYASSKPQFYYIKLGFKGKYISRMCLESILVKLGYDSFLPTAIREWNNLSEEIRNSQTFPIFKSKLYANRRRPPSYFNYGPRTLQVLQTRLRLECSSLNHHLSKKNIVDSAICSCGAIETTKHYLLICPNYTAVRNQVLSNYLNTLIKTLLSGDPLLNDEANQNIFKAVQTFIERTKRFS